MSSLLFCIICGLGPAVLVGCREPVDEEVSNYNAASRECLSCHQLDFDANHRLDCLVCHHETQNAITAVENHPSILAQPAHPDSAAEVCNGCHETEVTMVSDNPHYTLKGHIGLTRSAFGSATVEEAYITPADLTSYEEPADVAELVDDLLSRRCLRCHVYTKGDDFSAVSRGTGCSACHLSFVDGRMISHQFAAKPANDRCLSCHYGNHVGYDFHGRFEHDFNEEYRTPYLADPEKSRPYGVEAHQLEEDVHQRAGMVCVDCHGKAQVMGSGTRPECTDCHQAAEISAESGPDARSASARVFTSAVSGKAFAPPRLTHQAHQIYGEQFSCQACHARWTYNDAPTHLLRIDHEEFYDFYKLSLDGSSEVLKIISSHISDDGELLEPVMSNKFSGLDEQGIWFKGYGERRWETVQLVEEKTGRITTGRPILDLRLSWVDEYEEARFDSVEPVDGVARMRPYSPHTIGRAGLFYEDRIRPFLETKDTTDGLPGSTPAEPVSAGR